jgi:tetratricopeptide (TPR) repeat protein
MGAHRQQIFAAALAHHRAGEPIEADAACRILLTHWPNDVDALNLRAVIACMAGRYADGTVLAEQVLAQRPDNLQALSTLGDALHLLGDGAGAVTAFERAVKQAPRDAGLHSRLGTALLETGRNEEAESAYRRSIAIADHAAQSHFNHAVALGRLDRTTEAIAAYRRAIALDPSHLAAHLNLGNVLVDRAEIDDAIVLYRSAIALCPDAAEAHASLGVALFCQRHHDEAAACLMRAIACDPDCATAHAYLGAVRREQGRPLEAVHACERAIGLRADIAEAHFALGSARIDLDQPEAAVAAYREALALAPTDARIHCNLAVALLRLDRVDDAVEACRTAITLNPEDASAHTNLGVALQRLDRLDEAIAAHERAIAIKPDCAQSYSNLADCFRDEGRLDESLQLNRQAVALASCEDLHRFNHALALLMEGDYEAGWPAYEVRRKAGILGPSERSLPAPEWRGEPLQGRTLLLQAEQGLGDTLQFVRYVRELLESGASIVIESQRPLTGLLQSLGPVRVVTLGEPLPPFDFHLPLMSLPNLLRTRLDSIPATIPYLAADPAKIARWKTRIGQTGDLAVGVVWSGNPNHKSDRRRSIAAATVLPDLVMPGVRLFSLQKDPRAEDASLLESMAAVITDLAPWLDDFTDTAAALEALDLVIAVDTSTAHLAGALGRPVWMMLPFALDWRWLRDREDSPWYPTMRLFRQSTPRIWTDVIGRIRSKLSRLAQQERDRSELPWLDGTGIASAADCGSNLIDDVRHGFDTASLRD